MFHSPKDINGLLSTLREQQTESPTMDCKADLPLETIGDRAYFIRHISALANNVESSYLLIGVEDKTWTPLGIPAGSSLLNSDETQHRMNQILSNRVDPNLAVQYRVHPYEGVNIGVVAIEGIMAPYIISINDQSYGGERTRSAPVFIYRGVFYIRRGANSVIANRQSELFGIIDNAASRALVSDEPDEFLIQNNYLSIDTEEFGRHNLSRRLLEPHLSNSKPWFDEFPSARSWISIVLLPAERGCQLETASLKTKLKSDQRIGRDGEWFHAIPIPLYSMLLNPRATPKNLSGEIDIRNMRSEEELTHFLRILPSGHIEFAGTYPMFFEREGVRCFSFVSIIGTLWQLLYFSKAIYNEVGYTGDVNILLNLIGTKNSRLADFAGDPHRGGWRSPFDPSYIQQNEDYYHDENIQIQRNIIFTQATDEEIGKIITDFAYELGSYYGQDEPRCFHPKTSEFPVREYMQKNVNA